MKHLVIGNYGTFLGITSERLTVSTESKILKEYPLNRLSSVTIAKNGVSFSSNLLLNCAMRGIKFFIFSEFAKEVVCLNGGQLHAVAKMRQAQFEFVEGNKSPELSKLIILGKIKNQKAVLLYYRKYWLKKNDPFLNSIISQVDKSIHQINSAILNLKEIKLQDNLKWREILMGIEGNAARIYWQTIVLTKYMPSDFQGREGRGANDVVNQMLNYGYGILSTYIWNCAINCGLEVYCGFFHVQRPGKPSLVLDLMEEYRPWVVDRNVIKLREHINNHGKFTIKLKEMLTTEIQKTFSKKYKYKDKNISLESLIQRQMYQLCGVIYGTQKYRPFIFKW